MNQGNPTNWQSRIYFALPTVPIPIIQLTKLFGDKLFNMDSLIETSYQIWQCKYPSEDLNIAEIYLSDRRLYLWVEQILVFPTSNDEIQFYQYILNSLINDYQINEDILKNPYFDIYNYINGKVQSEDIHINKLINQVIEDKGVDNIEDIIQLLKMWIDVLKYLEDSISRCNEKEISQ